MIWARTSCRPGSCGRPTSRPSSGPSAAIQTLLFEHLLGYTGVDVADRGADPEGDAVLTVAEMEHLIATWIVKIWQNRRPRRIRPGWDPGGDHSPNTLFAAAMEQGGFALQIPAAELYYELLPAHHVAIHGRRGVKIRGLWYDGAALDPYRDEPLRARRAAQGQVGHPPRPARPPGSCSSRTPRPTTGTRCAGRGCRAEGEIPAFSDARVAELLAAARAGRPDAALRRRTAAAAAGAARRHTSRSSSGRPSWRKQERTEHAREVDPGRCGGRRPSRHDRPPARPRLDRSCRCGGRSRADAGSRRRRRRRAAPPP